MLSRREILTTTLAGAGLLRLPGWLSAGARNAAENGRVLVLVQLEGGNDGLNTLVPWRDERYASLRPTLALEPRSLLRLDEWNALHPSLPRIARRFEQGQVSFVQNVGSPRPSLSHFRSKDAWDTAAVDEPLPAAGWIGKLEDSSPVERLALGSECLPRVFRGSGRAACAVPSLGEYRIRTAARSAPEGDARARERAIALLHGGTESGPESLLCQAYETARLSIRELDRVADITVGTRFPGTALGRDLEAVARILAAGLPTRFFHVVQSGYDTHTGQLKDHAELLDALDVALDAFLEEMERTRKLEQVLVMTISDFGRRAKESGIGSTAGTDHGAASFQMLCGGRLRGGISGGQPDLDALDANGNLVQRTDFRQVYASVIEGWLGGDARAVLGGTYPCLELFAA
jgi:uncharacterized protein (DUF1501 family)